MTERGGPILFIGDSITEQWSRFRPRFFPEHGFLNRGIGGQTTRDLRNRFAIEMERAAPRGLHLMGGLNDIAGNGGPIPLAETEDTLLGMAEEARSRGCGVLLASVTPADVIAWNAAVRPAEPIMALNARLARRAAALGIAFVDYHAVLRTPSGALRPGLGPDGSHLDARGYRLIEPLLLTVVAQAFGADAAARSTSVDRILRRARALFRP